MNSMLTMIATVVVFIATIVFVGSHPISALRWFLIAVVSAAGLAVGVVRGRTLRRAVRDGRVECLAGAVHVTMHGRAGWWLRIDQRSFHLPVRFWHVGPGLHYRVYVATAADLIVAMEPDFPAAETN